MALKRNAVILTLLSIPLMVFSWYAPFNYSTQWTQWIGYQFVLLLVIPFVLLFLLREWLADELGMPERENGVAWKWAGIAFVIVLPFLVYASRQPEFQIAYPRYPPAGDSVNGFLFAMAGWAVYMVCWEWFFRGFLLHILGRFVGVYAIFVQAVPFCLIHWGKPTPEVVGAFFAGIALGGIAWKGKSYLPCAALHWVCSEVFDVLVILRPFG